MNTDTNIEPEYDFSKVRGQVGNLYRGPPMGRPPLAYDPNPYTQPIQQPHAYNDDSLVVTDEMWQQYNTFVADQQRYAVERSKYITHSRERARALALTAEHCFDTCFTSSFYYRPGETVSHSEKSCLEDCTAKNVEYQLLTKNLFNKYLHLINQ
jgi:hypothetical protein